jgi:hypothetical protein
MVFWDVTPCGPLLRSDVSEEQLLVIANFVPSSQIIFTLKMEAIQSSGTSVLTRATRFHIPEDDILQDQ